MPWIDDSVVGGEINLVHQSSSKASLTHTASESAESTYTSPRAHRLQHQHLTSYYEELVKRRASLESPEQLIGCYGLHLLSLVQTPSISHSARQTRGPSFKEARPNPRRGCTNKISGLGFMCIPRESQAEWILPRWPA